MATPQKLTDRDSFSGTPTLANLLIHIVDKADTSQDAAGSSYKIDLAYIKSLFGQTLAETLVFGRNADSNGQINDNSTVASLHLNNRYLYDSAAAIALNWNTKQLNSNWDIAGNFSPSANNTYDLGTSSNGWANLYLASKIHFGSDLEFQNSGSEKVRITTGGLVGINNSSPNASLHIIGLGATSGTNALRVQNSALSNIAFFRNDGFVGFNTNSPSANPFAQVEIKGSGSFHPFLLTTSGGTSFFYADNSGRIGIGTAPAYKLDVSNSSGETVNLTSAGTSYGGAVRMTNSEISNYTWLIGVGGGDNSYVQGRGFTIRDVTANLTRLGLTTSGIVQLTTDQTTTASSVSGQVKFSQVFGGSKYKKVMIYLDNSTGTTTFNFPFAFTETPAIVETSAVSASVVTTLNTNSVEVTGAATTGFIFLEGY